MKKILVTGVGGGAGQSILKALSNTSFDIVGVDSEELAAGLYVVPKAYKGLCARDKEFINRLVYICQKEKCDMIFPGHDVELLPLANSIDRFKAINVTPVVSTPEVIRVCDDKLATYEFLKKHDFPVPKTARLIDFEGFDQSVVLKPQNGGARSKNTYVIHNIHELNTYRQLVDPTNCVVQEYIEGDEYTCGSVTMGGKCIGVIVMRRILRDGDTYKAFIEHNPLVESTVRAIVEKLQPFGACNVQLRVRNSVPYVFEINARCSGTTAARALAGFNEPEIIANYLINNTIQNYKIEDITILRYWKELVVSNDSIESMRNNGEISNSRNKL